jgi:hypothetical protein
MSVQLNAGRAELLSRKTVALGRQRKLDELVTVILVLIA